MTLRELMWLHTGHQRTAWDHTAAIVAKINNMLVAKDRYMIDSVSINPYRKAAGRRTRALPATPENIKRLKSHFAGGRRKRS